MRIASISASALEHREEIKRGVEIFWESKLGTLSGDIDVKEMQILLDFILCIVDNGI